MPVVDKSLDLEAGRATLTLSEREFGLFQRLIYDAAGIHLSPSKHALVLGRLSRRLRELGLTSFSDYYQLVTEGSEGELVRLLDAISTNETSFFRERPQFELLTNRILPALADDAAAGFRRRRLRIWSAACSSGEEPYSIAMTLLAQFPENAGWELEILASDLSTQVLARAQAARWPLEKSRDIPEPYLREFMLKGTGPQAGVMKAGPRIRDLVRFARINLNDERWPLEGPFDMIFCRNALIYFDARSRERTVRRLLDHLAPLGYLFMGHAEGLHGMTSEIRMVIPSVYRREPDPGRRARRRMEHP